MPSSYDNLHDLRNETALLYLAISDCATYRTLGIEPEAYYSGLHERIARFAEDAYEVHGQTEVSQQLFRVLTWGRERKQVTTDEENYCVLQLSDPPLGVVADPERLKRHQRARTLYERALVASAALERGNETEAVTLFDEAVQAYRESETETAGTMGVRDMTAAWRKEVVRATEGGISLGLRRLKAAVGPLFPGAVMVVGAQTGTGKSSFGAEMMLAAADDGTPCGYVSMEDHVLVFVSRWIGGFSGVSARSLHRGEQLAQAEAGVVRFGEYEGRIHSDVRIGDTEHGVMAAMSVMARKGVKLIVIDYIGEIQASVHQQDRRNELRWIVKRLKAHALRLGVALVLISQLSRPKVKPTTSEGEGDKYEPGKHDLKEAGDIENAADFVVLLWRKTDHDFEPINVKLAKSKIGGTGARWLMQREVYAEDAYGRRIPGSSRLREVVRERNHPLDHHYPSVVDDYVAVLATLNKP
jgi:replicative DNA helicase